MDKLSSTRLILRLDPSRSQGHVVPVRFATVVLMLMVLQGCASPGPYPSRRTSIGSLKASLADSEADRENLRKQVATLQGQKQQTEEALAEEESRNEELAERLANARNQMKRQGITVSELEEPTRP